MNFKNRDWLLDAHVDACEASGTASLTVAAMIDAHAPGAVRRLMLGVDKAYDASEFLAQLRQMCVTPHMAQKAISSAIDVRRHGAPAIAMSTLLSSANNRFGTVEHHWSTDKRGSTQMLDQTLCACCQAAGPPHANRQPALCPRIP